MRKNTTINPFEVTHIRPEDERPYGIQSHVGIWKLMLSGYIGTIISACLLRVLLFRPLGAVLSGIFAAVDGIPIFLFAWVACLLVKNHRAACLIAGIGGAATGVLGTYGWMALAAAGFGFFGAYTSARRTANLQPFTLQRVVGLATHPFRTRRRIQQPL